MKDFAFMIGGITAISALTIFAGWVCSIMQIANY